MSDSGEKTYWQGLEDSISNGTEVGEFLSSPLKEDDHNGGRGDSTENRREFLKLMGASFLMLGANACTRRPVEKIIPYLKKPEDVVVGVSNWYASTCSECSSSCGVLVKTREGRPIKIEGNEKHPISKGGLCAKGQASVLNLYDPDRFTTPQMVNGGSLQSISWDELDQKITDQLRSIKSVSGRVALLTGEVNSLSTNAITSEFLKNFSQSTHVVYDLMSAEEVSLAGELSYGTRAVPRYHFEKANLVVSFGADFMGTWHSPIEFAKGFSRARKISPTDRKMSKLISFESMMTLTGTNADERYRVRSGDELRAALGLASALIIDLKLTKYASDAAITGIFSNYSAASIESEFGLKRGLFKKIAQELYANRGKSLVLGGGQNTKGDNGVALDVVVNLLNSALENEGSTVDGTLAYSVSKSSYRDLRALIQQMNNGQIDALFIYQSNPIYQLPKSLGFEDAIKKVKLVVSFGSHPDETQKKSNFVVATNHEFESWGDTESQNGGVIGIRQPTISPMYSTRSFEDVLIHWAKKLGLSGSISSSNNWHDYLKNRWKDTVYRESGAVAPFAMFWESALREGFVDLLAAKGKRSLRTETARSFNSSALLGSLKVAKYQSTEKYGLVLYPKVSMQDGKSANNGWIQEMPDPVTKITWDNYVCISVDEAKRLAINEGDVLKLSVDTNSIEVPAHIQPGLHDKTLAVAIGYGRKGVGRVGSEVGVNVGPLAMIGQTELLMSGLVATIQKTGKTYKLASTQMHHSMESRPIVKETTLAEFKKNPKSGNEEKVESTISLWPKHEYLGYRWAMSIDLTACNGCSACVIACQSENNIPVVGKEFVLTGREMHWLRIDRYYSGRADQPEVVHQPMLCQHCENAPCETVCPVLATMHDDEGLNQQVYNRCVGTRYCSNNCPYKVRRFNWYTFTDVAKPLNLAFNPDITVRTRGIMEKCTFCMQRISEGKDLAKDLGRKVIDGEIKTACQQSCPTDAIVFGNINDASSQVSKYSKDPRGYHVLEELNAKPSITYLTKVRNT